MLQVSLLSLSPTTFQLGKEPCFINPLSSGSAIEASLKQLAERRTDIFGVGDEETAIGKKIGEEDTRKDEKVSSYGFILNFCGEKENSIFNVIASTRSHGTAILRAWRRPRGRRAPT